MRKPYTTDCQFNRDDPRTAKIKWIVAQKDAPCLGVPSAISSLQWSCEPQHHEGVGEVWGAKKPPNNSKPIPGATGEHVCGTPEDFALGGVTNETLPPVVYTTTGLPVCCGPAIVPRGGGGAGGKSVPSVIPAPRISGGGGAGGKSVPMLSVDGSTTCSGAPTLALDTSYVLEMPDSGVLRWWLLPTVAGVIYHIDVSGDYVADNPAVYAGASCGVAGSVHSWGADGCWDFTATFGALYWFVMQRAFGVPQVVDFRMGTGPC